jgi:flagellar basal-body rod protein FlgB
MSNGTPFADYAIKRIVLTAKARNCSTLKGITVLQAASTEPNRFVMKFVDSHHSQLLGRAMDTYTLRQRVTAGNIANADTPGFNKHRVDFEEELQRVKNSEGIRGMKEVTPSIVETDQKIELEDELLEMADTQARVQLVTRSLRHHFELLKNGITGINR